jgi:hypothetical protein
MRFRVGREDTVLHQVHVGKLAADITAWVLSTIALWQHLLVLGVAVRIVLPIAGSAIVLATYDARRLRATRRGRYVVRNMPAWCQAVRLGGDVVTAAGAWWHSWLVIVVGLAVVALGWSRGPLVRTLPRNAA